MNDVRGRVSLIEIRVSELKPEIDRLGEEAGLCACAIQIYFVASNRGDADLFHSKEGQKRLHD